MWIMNTAAINSSIFVFKRISGSGRLYLLIEYHYSSEIRGGLSQHWTIGRCIYRRIDICDPAC